MCNISMLKLLELIESGSEQFLYQEYDIALNKFNTALQLLEKSNSDDKKDVKYMVKYLISNTLLQYNQFGDLLEALDILIDLEISMEGKYPIVYYGLSKAYYKLYRFQFAANTIQRGIEILNNDEHLETFTAPPKCIRKETTNDGLLLSLLDLREKTLQWRYPDAKCALDKCQNVFRNCPPAKDIYFSDPSFTGFVNVTCSNKNNPCNLNYHPNCWKFIKDNIDPSKDISNLDMLSRLCLKPNCKNLEEICLITKIEIYNDQAKVIETIEDSLLLKLTKSNYPASKGAVKKKKQILPSISSMSIKETNKKIAEIKRKKEEIKKKTEEMKKKDEEMKKKDEEMKKKDEEMKKKDEEMKKKDEEFKKINKEILDRENSLNKLKELRENYFYPLIGKIEKDWECKKIEDADQFNGFLLEILYEYIKSKKVLSKAVLIIKWHETKLLFPDSPEIKTILDSDIIDLLLKHTQLIMIGDIICIPQDLEKALVLFEEEVIENYEKLITDNFDTEIAKSAIDKVLSNYNPEFENIEDEEENNMNISSDSSDKISNASNKAIADTSVDAYLKSVTESKYIDNNNDDINDVKNYIDDIVKYDLIYSESAQLCVDHFLEKYFNKSSVASNDVPPDNINTVLSYIIQNDEMSTKDKQDYLEEFYYLTLKNGIKLTQQYMQGNDDILKSKLNHNQSEVYKELNLEKLLEEDITNVEQGYSLIKEYKQQTKSLKINTKNFSKRITQLDKSMNEIKEQVAVLKVMNLELRKQNAVQKLELQYLNNKNVLSDVLHCSNAAVEILSKINNMIESYCGSNIDSDYNEWRSILSEVLHAAQDLEMEYATQKSLVDLMKQNDLREINMKYIQPPLSPTKNLCTCVTEAFTLLYRNLTDLTGEFSELFSILSSYSPSDISQIIPSHLVKLKEFLCRKEIGNKNIYDNRIKATKQNYKTKLENIYENIESIDKKLQSTAIEQVESEDIQTKDTVVNDNVIETSNDNEMHSPLLVSINKALQSYDTEQMVAENIQTKDKVDCNNVIETSNDNKTHSPLLESINKALQIYDTEQVVPENNSTKDKVVNINVMKTSNDNKIRSSLLDCIDKNLQSYYIEEVEPENIQTKDETDCDCVIETSNDNKIRSPIFGTSIKIKSDLFMKCEDSMENKTHGTTNDTTIKDDNTNIEGKEQSDENSSY